MIVAVGAWSVTAALCWSVFDLYLRQRTTAPLGGPNSSGHLAQ